MCLIASGQCVLHRFSKTMLARRPFLCIFSHTDTIKYLTVIARPRGLLLLPSNIWSYRCAKIHTKGHLANMVLENLLLKASRIEVCQDEINKVFEVSNFQEEIHLSLLVFRPQQVGFYNYNTKLNKIHSYLSYFYRQLGRVGTLLLQG